MSLSGMLRTRRGTTSTQRIAPTTLSSVSLLYSPCISRSDEEPSCSRQRASTICRLSSVGKQSSSSSRANQLYGDLLVSKLYQHQTERDFELQGLFGPSPVDWRRKTTRMKQAKSWAELRSILPSRAADWTNCDTICLSSALSSLARVSSVSRNASAVEISKSFWVLMALARPRFSEFDNQGLVSIAVAVAKLKEVISTSPSSQDLPLILNELLEASKLSMDSFSPQSLANLIWALATFDYQPCGSWLTSFYRQVDDQLDLLKSQDVANILWSLCKIDLMPDIWVRDGLVERALGAIKEQVQGPQSVASGPAKGQDPATLIQCLARWYYLYNYRVSDEWLSEYLALVQPSLDSYLPFDLVSIIHSCVVMNYQPSRSWMVQYYAHIMHSLKYDPTLSYSDFQRLMWALSRIDFTPPQTWQKEFMLVSIPKLKHLKIRALTELVWALACWDTRPSPEWMAAFFTASHAKLEDARPQHMACMLNAAAKLEITVPEPWLDQALDSFCHNIEEAKAHDVVSVLENITIVCAHKSWLSHRSTQQKIRQLSEIAGAKFGLLDAFMHGKLLTALAIADVTPAADWLKRQQQYLAAALVGGGSSDDELLFEEEYEGPSSSLAYGTKGDSMGEGEENSQRVKEKLKGVYEAWQVDVDPRLRRALM